MQIDHNQTIQNLKKSVLTLAHEGRNVGRTNLDLETSSYFPSQHHLIHTLVPGMNSLSCLYICVSEAKLLAKYEGLVFSDPSTRKMFSIWNKHMEFHRGERNGWNLIGVCGDDLSGNEDEPFLLEIAYALIGYTPQRYGIQVIYNNWA